MKTESNAQMLQIYFGEQDQWQRKPLYVALIEECVALGIAGATVCRGIAGFGASSTIHRSSLWSFSKDASIMVTIVDTPEQIAKLTPSLQRMVTEGLVVRSSVQSVRYQRDTPPPSARE